MWREVYCVSVEKAQFNSITKYLPRGTWVAQSVKRPTLDVGSGHDPAVREFELRVGLCSGRAEAAWDSLSPSLCPSPTHTHSHSQNE